MAILNFLSFRSVFHDFEFGFWKTHFLSVLPYYLGCSCCLMWCFAGTLEVVSTYLITSLILIIQQVDGLFSVGGAVAQVFVFSPALVSPGS